MNSIKIIVAVTLIVLGSNVLAGCSPQDNSDVGVKRLEEAQEMKKTVSMSLVEVEGASDITLRLILENPEGKPVTSVQTWLAYNPEVLKGISIDISESDFEFMAPYDNAFDEAMGLMMLGRSSAMPVEAQKIVVADLHFERLAEGVAMIEAFDYQYDLEGHTSANMMQDGDPLNILLKPDSPLLILN